MKGITPVIAIILLLMITIALIGFAFVWFTSIAGTLTNQTGQQLTQQQRKMMTSAKIDALDTTSGTLVIRNTGTVALKISELEVYVNNTAPVSDCSFTKTELTPGETDSCTSGAFQDCINIVITTIGTGDTKSC